MANRFLITAGGTSNVTGPGDSTDGWDAVTSLGLGAADYPVADDSVYCDANSGTLTIAADWPTTGALTLLDLTGYTGTASGVEFTVHAGAFTISGGDITTILHVSGQTTIAGGTVFSQAGSAFGAMSITGGQMAPSGVWTAGAITVDGGELTASNLTATSVTLTSGTVSGDGYLATTGDITISANGADSSFWTHTSSIGCGGTFTLAEDTITVTPLDGSTFGAFALNAGTLDLGVGTHSQTGAALAFTIAGGTLTGSGQLNVAGSLVRTSGTNSFTGVFNLTGTGNLSWIDYVSRPAAITCAAAGKTTTLTTTSYTTKLTTGTGALAGVAIVVVPAANNSFVYGGGSIVNTILQFTCTAAASYTNAGFTAAPSTKFHIEMANTRSLTFTSAVNLGASAMTVASAAAGICTAAFSAGLTAGAVTLGGTAGLLGGLTLAGSSTIASLNRSVAGNTGHVLTLTGTVVLSGILEGTGITINATNAVIVGGTLTNCTVTGTLLHLNPTAAGTGTGFTEMYYSKRKRTNRRPGL